LEEALRLSSEMLRGLAYLHEEIVMGNEEIRKPTIVHRDLKSRNILLKADLTVCIADFGLAMKCEHGRTPEETHGQVGTRRYMAPEVLEGAVAFSAFAFRQIDVYAAALILWEITHRCSVDETSPDSYKLPFEEEAGIHPTLQEMQQLVVNGKKRPQIVAAFRLHPKGSVMSNTMEEMWDAEPEARITAGCALGRLLELLPPSMVVELPDVGLSPESYPLITDLAEESNV
jgi:serine/threonine protein kinase